MFGFLVFYKDWLILSIKLLFLIIQISKMWKDIKLYQKV